MEYEAKQRKSPFLQAKARLKNRYDLVMDTDDFIEKAYYIWRDIGNIATLQQEFSVDVPPDGIVELPSNCEFVQSIVTQDVLPNTLRNTSSGRRYSSSQGFKSEVTPYEPGLSNVSATRASKNYQYGVNVAFTTGDGFIEVTSATMYNRPITILYSAILTDEDGLPMLNDKEVSAIAANIALQLAERKLFIGDKGADSLVQYLKTESDRLFQAAKIPEKISDNAIDKLLDIKTSWGRKVYGSRFNMIP